MSITLDEIKAHGSALSPWAHVATVRPDGTPDVVPVHPCWEGDVLWFMCGAESVKARNLATNPKLTLSWQVTEVGDCVEIWGTGEVFTDLATKRRLWEGVFDYDLNAFAPGGPDNSEGTAFVAVTPTKALYMKMYGMGGSFRWKPEA
jgi:general stress protein 26